MPTDVYVGHADVVVNDPDAEVYALLLLAPLRELERD